MALEFWKPEAWCQHRLGWGGAMNSPLAALGGWERQENRSGRPYDLLDRPPELPTGVGTLGRAPQLLWECGCLPHDPESDTGLLAPGCQPSWFPRVLSLRHRLCLSGSMPTCVPLPHPQARSVAGPWRSEEPAGSPGILGSSSPSWTFGAYAEWLRLEDHLCPGHLPCARPT